MRSTAVIAACAVVLIGGAVIEESRISKLNQRIGELQQMLAKTDRDGVAKQGLDSESTIPSRPASKSPSPQKEILADEESSKSQTFGETMRKIYENKAGRAMIREENRRRAGVIYERLIADLNLSEEEEEHFLDLLAPSVGEQDRVGMALFNAKNDEERIKLIDDMEKDQVDRREAIKTFLNNDEDFTAYEDHHNRKSEYEQISSIHSVMADSGSPMSPEQESNLIEAMYEARTETGLSERWEGREGFYQFSKPEPSKRFAEDWEQMQNNLNGRVGQILNESQQDALIEHQNQIEQFVLMGLTMAETMMKNAGHKPDQK